MTQVLSGKTVAKAIYAKMKVEIEKYQLDPKLVIILIGNDPAAEYYIQNLEKKGFKIF